MNIGSLNMPDSLNCFLNLMIEMIRYSNFDSVFVVISKQIATTTIVTFIQIKIVVWQIVGNSVCVWVQ